MRQRLCAGLNLALRPTWQLAAPSTEDSMIHPLLRLRSRRGAAGRGEGGPGARPGQQRAVWRAAAGRRQQAGALFTYFARLFSKLRP